MIQRTFALLLLLLAAVAGYGASADEGRPMGTGFSIDEILMIRSYFQDAGSSLVPIMQANEKGMPETARNRIQVNTPIPSELRRRLQSIPIGLIRALPAREPGLRRMVLGSRVVLLDSSFRLVDQVVISIPAPEKKK